MSERTTAEPQKTSVPSFSPVGGGSILQRACACGQHTIGGQECEGCRAQRTSLQRRPVNESERSEVPPIVYEVLRSPGQPLDRETRAFFEPRFGHDFSSVRVHTEAKAAESAKAVSALAYTVGHDVVFAAGHYSSDTAEGRDLLAHELTHVVQQRNHNRLQLKPQPREKSPHPAEKVLPEDKKKEEVPEGAAPSGGALKALAAAQKLYEQTDPAIWFDSWGNDLRDNDLKGKIDGRSEQGLDDGSHYSKTFDAVICKDRPSDTTESCPMADQSRIKVNYKVCIDVPIESYKAAGVSISTNRRIPSFFGELTSKPDWTVWKKPARPANLLDGDVVAASNPHHQHAGIVETGWPFNSVLNLPGPTAARKFGLFYPSGRNDMKSVPRWLFEAFLSIDWIARHK